MRDRMERFMVHPFSIGCVSQASVAVAENQPKKSKEVSTDATTGREEDGKNMSDMKTKSSFGFLPLQKPNISTGLQRLVKGIKSFSQLFASYKEDEMDEREMEIGLPTDVKHVAHIGWDGSTTTTTTFKGWDDFKPPELLSLPSISLKHFEAAMAAQADTSIPTTAVKLA